MFGALRLVSVEQGYDPRDFALVAFGGAGPLHANALGKLLGLLAGHHSARSRRAVRLWRRDDAAAQRGFAHARPPFDAHRREPRSLAVLDELEEDARKALDAEGVDGVGAGDAPTRSTCAITARACGSRSTSTLDEFRDERASTASPRRFDEMHKRLFTFALDAEHEIVNLRAVVQGPEAARSSGAVSATAARIRGARLRTRRRVYVATAGDHGAASTTAASSRPATSSPAPPS